MFKFEYKLMTIRDVVRFHQEHIPTSNTALVQNRRTWTMDTMKKIEEALTTKGAELFCFLLKTSNYQTKGTDYQILNGGMSLQTINDFVDGDFALSCSWLDKAHRERLGGKTFTELPPSMQEAFLNQKMSIWIIQQTE